MSEFIQRMLFGNTCKEILREHEALIDAYLDTMKAIAALVDESAEEVRSTLQTKETAKMSEGFFKAEDFWVKEKFVETSAHDLAKHANALLKERGVRVFWERQEHNYTNFTSMRHDDNGPQSCKSGHRDATHTALLINVQPIRKDTAESLLREIYAEMLTWQDVDSPLSKLIERAKALLERERGE